MSPAGTTGAPPSERRFDVEVEARISTEERAALHRLRWLDRLTSLWAPVVFLALAFALYLIGLGVSVCSARWLQPAMKIFGAAMVATFAGLLLVRLVWPAFARRRLSRQWVEEQWSNLGGKRRRRLLGALAAPAWDELLRLGVQVLQAVAASAAPDEVERRLKSLHGALDQHVPGHRSGAGMEFAGGFAKALMVALLLRAVVLEPFKIPSGSMIPTLEIGDHIFVNKFIYGVRIPWMNEVPFVVVREPARGDVIVFNNPVEPDKDYVKRVVGIGGDRVEIRDKVVFVNGQAQATRVEASDYRFWDQDPYSKRWYGLEGVLFRETLGGKPHLALRDQSEAEGGEAGLVEGPYEVPPGHVFVMGDNRDKSMDSRFGLGRPELGVQYVPHGYIKGKAMVIWLSLAHGGLFSELFGGTGVRTDRFFRPVPMCADGAPETRIAQ